MDEIRLWVAGLASAAIAGAIILTFAPVGGTEKAIKTMVSVFLISSIVLPFAQNKEHSLDMDWISGEIAQENGVSIATEVSEQMKTKLALSIENILKKEGIQVHSVSIDIKTDGNEISVEKIVVVIKKESSQRLGAAKDILETQLGVRAIVEVEDTED